MQNTITKRELTEALDNHYIKLSNGFRYQAINSNGAAVCLGKMELIETILKVLKNDSTAALQDLSGRDGNLA